MIVFTEEGRRPRDGGGHILTYDPDQKSIKEAFKVLIFSGAAIESMWHQKAVEIKSKSFAEKTDRSCNSVREKFEVIGLADEELLNQIASYYEARRQLVHEKVHSAAYKKKVFTAQNEAEKAFQMVNNVKSQLERINA